MDINNYIKDKSVKRLVVANDIASLKINKSDIGEICDKFTELEQNGELDSVFIGDFFIEKLDKSEWNKEYLGSLKNKSVSEVFNKDYLIYLNDVARYLHHEPKKRISIISSIVCAFILMIVIILIATMKRETSNSLLVSKYMDGNEIEKTFIACDIAYSKISKNDLDILIKDLSSNKNLNKRKVFVTKNTNKLMKKDWNQSYIEDLIKRANDSWFNEEYLLHLYEVTNYVNNQREIRGE